MENRQVEANKRMRDGGEGEEGEREGGRNEGNGRVNR